MKEKLEKYFQSADISQDGKISIKELGPAMEAVGVKLRADDVHKTIEAYDRDGSGDLNVEEFKEMMSDIMGLNSAYEKAYEVFKDFDGDNDGIITREEIKGACEKIGSKMSEQEFAALIDQWDVDKSGEINFDEFARVYVCQYSW